MYRLGPVLKLSNIHIDQVLLLVSLVIKLIYSLGCNSGCTNILFGRSVQGLYNLGMLFGLINQSKIF